MEARERSHYWIFAVAFGDHKWHRRLDSMSVPVPKSSLKWGELLTVDQVGQAVDELSDVSRHNVVLYQPTGEQSAILCPVDTSAFYCRKYLLTEAISVLADDPSNSSMPYLDFAPGGPQNAFSRFSKLILVLMWKTGQVSSRRESVNGRIKDVVGKQMSWGQRRLCSGELGPDHSWGLDVKLPTPGRFTSISSFVFQCVIELSN